MSTPQLPLALRTPADRSFDGFAGQAMAVAWLRRLAAGDEHGTAFLSGPAASGKSHLLFATVGAARAAGRSPAYIALAAARGRVRDLLAGHDHADPIALDGLDAIAGDRDDEIALFDFHNRAHDAGRSVLYAARATPLQLALVLPDLRSRLGQCTQLALDVPDDNQRRDVLRLHADRRGLVLDDAVLDFMQRRVGRDLATLIDLLDRLDRASLAAQRRVTVPLVRDVLGL